jgi:Flp pilus assembly protein TadD
MSVAYARTEAYDEAVALCEKAVHREPDNLMARMFLAAIYGLAGRAEEARVEAAEVIRISPKRPYRVDDFMGTPAWSVLISRGR